MTGAAAALAVWENWGVGHGEDHGGGHGTGREGRGLANPHFGCFPLRDGGTERGGPVL